VVRMPSVSKRSLTASVIPARAGSTSLMKMCSARGLQSIDYLARWPGGRILSTPRRA
jgi:hypothetical protein